MHQDRIKSLWRGIGTIMFVLFLFSIDMARAQSVWTLADQEEGVAIEWLKFDMDNDYRNNTDHPSALSSSMFITGRIKLDPRFHLVGGLPISHWQYIDPVGPDAQDPHTAIGKMYIGAEWYLSPNTEDASSYLEMGFRFPSMKQPDFPDERGAFSGRLTAFERTDAFRYRYTPIHLYYNTRFGLTSHLDFRARMGLAYWSFREESGYGSTDENLDRGYIHYGGVFYFQSEYVNATAGILGRYLAINQPDGVDHMSARYEVGSHIQYNGNTIRPGLFLKIPVNGLYNVSAVYGITAEIPLRKR